MRQGVLGLVVEAYVLFEADKIVCIALDLLIGLVIVDPNGREVCTVPCVLTVRLAKSRNTWYRE